MSSRPTASSSPTGSDAPRSPPDTLVTVARRDHARAGASVERPPRRAPGARDGRGRHRGDGAARSALAAACSSAAEARARSSPAARTALGLEQRAHWQRLDARQSLTRVPAPTDPAEALLPAYAWPDRRARRAVGLADLAERAVRARPARGGSLLVRVAMGDARGSFGVVAGRRRPRSLRRGSPRSPSTRAERLLLALRTSGRRFARQRADRAGPNQGRRDSEPFE